MYTLINKKKYVKMSCNIKRIKGCEIAGSTFNGRKLSLNRDISSDSFKAKVKTFNQKPIAEITGVKNATDVYFPFNGLENLSAGLYIIEYWGDFEDIGNELFCVEEFSVVSPSKAGEAQCCDNYNVFNFVTEDISIDIQITATIVNIGGNVDLSNYYTKSETDLLLENYYLKTETYSQDEVDSLFSNETLDAITDRGNTTENDIKVGGVTTDYVQLDTTSTNTYNIGKVYWNSDKGTYNFGLLNNVELQLGQEQYVYGKAYSAISNGQLVMYRTSQGGHILFEPANFTQLSTNPDLIIGVATQDIALNDFGYITTFGEVNTLNTSSFADGGTLYFGSGNILQNTAPTGSYFIVGRVNRSHATQGSIFVKPYFVDGNLESKSNKSDSYTASSSTTYASSKALVDGLATKADLVDGKVPSSQLPSYVDDVLEFANLASFPATGESGKIYIAIDTNVTYRWSGTGYSEISASLALGETSSTAYRGDRGKIAYDHSQITHDKTLVGLGNVDNTSDLNKPISTATQTALNLKLSTEAPSTTGTVISFSTDKVYGTLTTPENGNITADVTNAKLGVTNIIIHNSVTAPTFGSEFKKLSGSGNYITGVVNYIYCTYISTTEIIYSINQRT